MVCSSLKYFIFFSFFVPFSFARHACSAVSNYHYSTEITSFSQFSVEKHEGNNVITVSNISVVGVDYEEICVRLENKEPSCFDDLPQNFEFSIENSTFKITVEFSSYGLSLAIAVFDNGRFVSENGGMFSPEVPCLTPYGHKNANRTYCCTSFITIPDLPINAPTCISFRSRSTIYNVIDNYSIFGTSQANFTRQANYLAANISYIGTLETLDGAIWAPNALANCKSSTSIPTFCKLFGPTVDNGEWLLRGSFYSDNPDIPPTPSFLIGRIIFSSNQTVMEEGVPFTPKHNCFYHTEQISASQIAASSLCCTEFQE